MNRFQDEDRRLKGVAFTLEYDWHSFDGEVFKLWHTGTTECWIRLDASTLAGWAVVDGLDLIARPGDTAGEITIARRGGVMPSSVTIKVIHPFETTRIVRVPPVPPEYLPRNDATPDQP